MTGYWRMLENLDLDMVICKLLLTQYTVADMEKLASKVAMNAVAMGIVSNPTPSNVAYITASDTTNLPSIFTALHSQLIYPLIFYGYIIR